MSPFELAPTASNNSGGIFPGACYVDRLETLKPIAEPAPGLTGENFVFIVGCPRSGTTWLQRLLATHPDVQTGQESRVFEYVGTQLKMWQHDLASQSLYGRGGLGLACYLEEPEFMAIQKKYLASLLAPMLGCLRPGQIFLEKTPAHALYLPEIITLLPAAKIIHLIRDPRDVVASYLAAARGWGRHWAAPQVKAAVHAWRNHVSAAQAAGKLLPPAQYAEIHYEDLLAGPVARLQGLVTFLHLTWPAAEIARAVKTNQAGELRQGKGTPIPIHGVHGRQPDTVVQEPRDFVRKARAGTWREDLTLMERWQLARALRKIPMPWERYRHPFVAAVQGSSQP